MTLSRQRQAMGIVRALTMLAVLAVTLFAFAPIAKANFDLCGVNVGNSTWCYNAMTIQDNLAYAHNDKDDYFNAPDAYHIHYTMTRWDPSVTRGTPVYETYWITDNFNGGAIIYSNDDYNGSYLTDYGYITIGTNVTAGYYPQPYDSPQTVLTIRNADPSDCAAQWWDCILYQQVSQMNVN